MSIPFPLNNNSPSSEEDSEHIPQRDVLIKPFRAPVARPKSLSFNPDVLRFLYDDKKELKQASIYGLISLTIIIGSIVAKTGFTFATLALMVIGIFWLALVDTWNAIFLFIVYLALEGMYKYTSNFSPLVYIMAPVLSTSIFIAWRIRSRGEAERKESLTNAPAKPSLFQSQLAVNEIGLPKIAPLVLALVALCFLQAANPDSPGLFNSLNGALVWYLGPISFFFITYYTLRNRKEAMGFIYTLLFTGFVVSAYAIFQFNMGQSWVYAHVPGMQNMALMIYSLDTGNTLEAGAYRPAATAPIAGGYVVISCMAMLAALCVATMPRMVTWRRVLSLLSMSVMTMALVVSAVRQVVLNLFVVVPVLLMFSVRRFEDAIRIYFMMFLVGGLLATSFLVADSTAGGKLSKRFGTVFTGNPLDNYAKNRGGSLVLIPQAVALRPFGIGIRRGTGTGSYGPGFIQGKGMQVFWNRETQWNAIHADLGVLGLITLFLFAVAVIYQGAVICRRLPDPNLRYIGAMMYTIIIFNWIASLGSAVLQSNYIFWSACGILFALPRIAASERKMLADSVTQNTADSDASERLLV